MAGQPETPFMFGPTLLELACLEEGDRIIKADAWIIGVRHDGLPIKRKRFLHVARRHFHVGEVGTSGGIAGKFFVECAKNFKRF